jgi:hypothetical protein
MRIEPSSSPTASSVPSGEIAIDREEAPAETTCSVLLREEEGESNAIAPSSNTTAPAATHTHDGRFGFRGRLAMSGGAAASGSISSSVRISG